MKIKANLINASTNIILLVSSILMIKTIEANLWEIKYFTPVKIACSLSPLTNIGIKQSIFISKQTHCLNNLFELIDNKTHDTITIIYPINGVINNISSVYSQESFLRT